MLRNRDLNAQKNRDLNAQKNLQGLKPTTAKHKTDNVDEKDGAPKPKRVALVDITTALSTTLIDSSKKQTINASPKKDIGRLCPLVEQELSSSFEVDPAPDFDYDKENANDPYAVSEFASDIHRYYKHREKTFVVPNYFNLQRKFEQKDRATAVDWLVQIQESFEFNHETMYLAVKLMDMYISKLQPHTLVKSMLQLIPCVAVFIAAKVEERCAPSIEDLLYLCKNSYTADQLKKLERDMLRTVGFDLGIPLSYSFLRRYSRVSKSSMSVLTTARYYLEVSLHYLDFCVISESKLSAACMLLALRVTKTGDWNAILEKYSGYKLADIEYLVHEVSRMVIRFPHEYKNLKSVVEKYSHPIFFEVAKQQIKL